MFLYDLGSFRLVSEIQMMVGELRRITLLWDELWLGTLNQHQADVTRRLQQLEHEVKKVNSIAGLDAQQKSAIIREKHNTVLKPVSTSPFCPTALCSHGNDMVTHGAICRLCMLWRGYKPSPVSPRRLHMSVGSRRLTPASSHKR